MRLGTDEQTEHSGRTGNKLRIKYLVDPLQSYEPGGRGFESCRARQSKQVYSDHI